MIDVGALEGTIAMLLWVVQLGIKAFALVDAARHSGQAYPAADKQSKKFWVVVLALALAANLLTRGPLGILTVIGTIAALVYLVDARPALMEVERRGGRSSGPYGPW